jgi:hypothetical protein
VEIRAPTARGADFLAKSPLFIRAPGCGWTGKAGEPGKIRLFLTHIPQAAHSGAGGRLGREVEKESGTAIHPPKVSVSLLSSLFKSLSLFRLSSIFSTECSTVVWCLPPNWRPISGSEASVRCLARYMAICRG